MAQLPPLPDITFDNFRIGGRACGFSIPAVGVGSDLGIPTANTQVKQDRSRYHGHLAAPVSRTQSLALRDSARSPPTLYPTRTRYRPRAPTACTYSTLFTGFSRSVSRVPGADPRTSTPPTAPRSVRMTVQPVGPFRARDMSHLASREHRSDHSWSAWWSCYVPPADRRTHRLHAATNTATIAAACVRRIATF